VSSQFPIVRIWRVNQEDCDGMEIVDLREGGDHVLVSRNADAVELHRLPPAEFALLRSLSRGATLGDSLEIAQAVASDFDLAKTLRHIVELGALTAVHTT